MSGDNTLSVFTDKNTVSSTWQAFLSDKAISHPVTPVAGSADIECTATSLLNIKFSTAANSAQFHQLSPYIDPTNKDIVVLGLKQGQATSVLLKDVFSFFTGAPSLSDGGLIGKIVDSIEKATIGDVQVQLDASEARNAVWFIAGQMPIVTTALVFSFTDHKTLAGVKQCLSDFGLALKLSEDLPSTQLFLQRTSTGIQISAPPVQSMSSNLDTAARTAPSADPIAATSSFAVSTTYTLMLKSSMGGLDFWLRLEPNGVSVSITQTPVLQGSQAGSFWDRLEDFVGTSPAPTAVMAKPNSSASRFSTINPAIDLLRITVAESFGSGPWWKIQSVLQWDSSLTDTPNLVLVGLSYDARDSTFTGSLLTKNSIRVDQRLPFFVPGADALPLSFAEDPSALAKWPGVLKLSDLFEAAESLPRAVPDTITMAELSFSNPTSGSTLSLDLTLARVVPDKTTDTVPAPFTWDQVSLVATHFTPASGKKTDSTLYCALSTSFTLNPRDDDLWKFEPAAMGFSIIYTDGSWAVSAYVDSLQCGLLFSFFDFDDTVGSAMADVAGDLEITELDVLYTYNAKLASSFLITGTVTLGILELRLFYQYVSSKATVGRTAADMGRKPGDPQTLPIPESSSVWAFECTLGAANGQSTSLGAIVDSVVPGGSSEIPDFASGIMVAPADGESGAVSIKVVKQPLQLSAPSSTGIAGSAPATGDAPTAVVFVLDINLLGVKFSFIQIGSNGTKRYLLRLSVDKIPLIGSIPLIDKLAQPFSELLYLWVSGTSNLTEEDVSAINAALAVLGRDDQLLFKASTKPNPNNVAIVHGHHFMVIEGGQVTLDHAFTPSTDEISSVDTNAEATSSGTNAGSSGTGGGQALPTPPNNEPTKGALNKTIGPLSFSAITLQYKDKVLWVQMDATLALGPISLGLLGFGIGFDTTSLKLNNLKNIATDVIDGASRLKWELQGLSLAFDKPPLVLAGSFEHDTLAIAGGTEDVYKGGVGVGFPPYTFIGVGEYANVMINGSSYKSVFVFAKLDGPLVTLEFATISGVRLGFGFNSIVRSPGVADIITFPFIQNAGSSGAGDNPMLIMQEMDPLWVTPKLDSYWFAAGMTITAFDVVAITAIAMFAFRDSGVVISIVADAIGTMPPNASDAEAILYVEIGMIAELNFIDGYFVVQAALAPTSFLLVPQCHLTGGFALAYWFGGNNNAGDFVFSVGGYHRAYAPPPYYPVPARIGINFQIGDNIQMTGQSYFAITPKVIMGGALIHVSLSVGPVSAYLDATFDALINFHPLHYVVDFAISVGVECDIDIWFIHIHISVHIGADLHIEGPPFHGIAHVDFWFFGFDVHFGPGPKPLTPLSLLEFWKTTHQPGPGTSDRADNDGNPLVAALSWNEHADLTESVLAAQSVLPGAAFKYVLQDGNMPQPMQPTGGSAAEPSNVPSTGAGASWFVKGGTFQFGITTEFALSDLTVSGTVEAGKGPISLTAVSSADDAVYSRPMQVVKPITSTLTVTIRHVIGSGREVIGGWLDVAFVYKSVPTALWSIYSSKLDITQRDPKGPPPSDLLNGSNPTLSRAMGVTVSAPKPILCAAQIPKFNATAAAEAPVQQTVNNSLEDWFIPDLEREQVRLLAANWTDTERALDPDQHWDAMAATWSGLATLQHVLNDPKDGILNVAATEIFGWNVNRPQAETGTPPIAPNASAGSIPPGSAWQLSGQLPANLIKGLKDRYLALPRMCVV